ncbi:hypothetical protein Xbed_03023 [Xenorhabdus beddingii]|uniref:ABC transporter domain-containing protein n=1 Tax=Xenorhabdus beddingii TaxID=40578 RepID=A0A1Y2SL68_9GAMM|nr:hypothetical protein Xbed_03023 [Xenorhabdus beddingii]
MVDNGNDFNYHLMGWKKKNQSVSEPESILMSRRYLNLVSELSGGQRQRAWFAMTLAQQTPIILLDEPTTYLDISYQIELLDLCQGLHRQGKILVLVLHDINLALRYASRLVMMKDGQIYAEGVPEEIVTVQNIADVFGLACRIIRDPESNKPLIIPKYRPAV